MVNPKVLEIENPIQLRVEQQGVKVVVSVWK
jgi:hypothetical protein